jgi:hypothetical protein
MSTASDISRRAGGTRQFRVLAVATGLGLLHAVDDAVLDRQPGVPVGQHLPALVAALSGAALVGLGLVVPLTARDGAARSRGRRWVNPGDRHDGRAGLAAHRGRAGGGGHRADAQVREPVGPPPRTR